MNSASEATARLHSIDDVLIVPPVPAPVDTSTFPDPLPSPVQAQQPPEVVKKPWGREIIDRRDTRYTRKLLLIHKGHRLSLQYHCRKHERMQVLQGRLTLTLGPNEQALQEQELGPGATIVVPAGWWHRLAAIQDSVVLEISTPESDDLVRVCDDYGRATVAEPAH